jgi:regulator of replication initiation timing
MGILKDKFDERALLKDLEEIKKNQQDILRDLKVIKHEQTKLKETIEETAFSRQKFTPSVNYPWHPPTLGTYINTNLH